MGPRLAPRILGVLFVLAGVWGLLAVYAFAQIPSFAGAEDRRLLPLAILVATANSVAGIALFVRPILGFAVALVAQIPQAFSFAVGSVAYALNLWPNYRAEFFFQGLDPRDAHALFYSFTTTPSWILRTDADYSGLGLGVDLVSTAVIVLLLGGLWAHRRTSRRA